MRKGWKRGYKIVTLCTDGKRRSMVCAPNYLTNTYPRYEPGVETIRDPALNAFMVFKTKKAALERIRDWSWECELWECEYLPAVPVIDPCPGQDDADAVRLVRKVAERTSVWGKLQQVKEKGDE